MKTNFLIVTLIVLLSCACQPARKSPESKSSTNHRLMVLAPGHFHADLLQKNMLPGVSDSVFVYAPEGFELTQYINRIESYNQRETDPTSWKEVLYTGSDYLQQMIAQKKGDIVVIAGNNQNKTDYIVQSVKAGLNVLADKPMAINGKQFELLANAFEEANRNGVMLYDIMTERFDVLNEIERVIIHDKKLFGEMEQGSKEKPAVELESVHHFFKTVSGKTLIRSPWYYDVEQQGEGIVDVTTHLIDIVNWKCFPETVLSYQKDVEMVSATRFPTVLTQEQFFRSTQLNQFPPYLEKYVKDSKLNVYSNGTIQYKIKGINVAIRVVWNYEAPQGSGDTFSSTIKGTKALCQIVQDQKQGSVTQLYVSPAEGVNVSDFELHLANRVKDLQNAYPSLTMVKEGDRYRLDVPASMRDGHEEHFSKVAKQYFGFLQKGSMPEWETSYMLTKYYITTSALEMAKKSGTR
ncbi:MAG: oxidoreductase [Bacteroidia bacterium]|nr:oxidoreductase [Bacteroidia bacterium]